MSLTSEQLAARKGKMTASRVACLMTQDEAEILQLYKEFIGEAEPENLDDYWPAVLGSHTEALQILWYMKKSGRVSMQGEVVTHPVKEWAACTLDGWDEDALCPIECKHVGGFEPTEIVIDRYQPQMQWQMWVTGAGYCALSMIKGAREPIVTHVDREQAYIDEMVERAEDFLMAVAMREPPVQLPPIVAPADATAIVNMTGNNAWAIHAQDYIDHYEGAHKYEESKKLIKRLVGPSVKRAFGHGINVTRDIRGSLRITLDKE